MTFCTDSFCLNYHRQIIISGICKIRKVNFLIVLPAATLPFERGLATIVLAYAVAMQHALHILVLDNPVSHS